MCGGNTKETYLESRYFTQFYKHFVFKEDEAGNRNKRIEKYFEVSAVVDVGWGIQTENEEFRQLKYLSSICLADKMWATGF